MANTIVGFTIEIDGVNSINDLNAKIKETKAQMNALDMSTEGADDQFKELANTLGKLTAEQKRLKKEQDDLNKSFEPEKVTKTIGAYDALSKRLNEVKSIENMIKGLK